MSYRVWYENYKHYYNSALLEFGMDEDLAYRYYEYAVKKSDFRKWRDSEKKKTYRAEWKFEKEFPNVMEAMTLKECQKFVDRVCKSKLWAQLVSEGFMGSSKVTVQMMRDMKGRGRLAGCSYGSWIAVSPTGGCNKYVLLHELAHSAGFRNHDHKFRAVVLRLVSRFIGQVESKGLKKTFRAAKLRVSPPIIKSPEAWLRAVARAPIKMSA
jgi:hypothetical protein